MFETLHIVHDGKVKENMSIEEIFVSEKYNHFMGELSQFHQVS